MKRRTFIAGLSAAMLHSVGARAQSAARPRIVGYIGPNTEEIDRPRIDAFSERLFSLGWSQGRDLVVDARFSDGVAERAGEIATAFVQRPVDLILTAGDAHVEAARRATGTIPVVFAAAGDPVGNGLVGSLSRPGGNVTGQSILLPDSVGKRIDLLRELVPGLHRLGLIGNIANMASAPEWKAAESQTRALGAEAVNFGFARAEDIPAAIAELKIRVDALYVCQDPVVASVIGEINASAIEARLPAMFSVSQWVERGGLVSYGPDFLKMYRRAAEMADKILRGAKPADIPVEQPTEFNLAINLKTARAIGLDLPATLLARADQVIE